MTTKQKVGDYNRRASIMKPVRTSNALNEEVITYTDIACVYCRIEYPRSSSDESIVGDQQMVMQRTVFVMRYRQDIDETYRIRYNSKDHDILYLRPLEDNQYLAVETEYRK